MLVKFGVFDATWVERKYLSQKYKVEYYLYLHKRMFGNNDKWIKDNNKAYKND